MVNNILKTLLRWLKYILVLFLFVLVYLFFSWWGIVGYFIFIFCFVAYIIYKRWEDYNAICDYGVRELRKFKKGDSNDKKKNK